MVASPSPRKAAVSTTTLAFAALLGAGLCGSYADARTQSVRPDEPVVATMPLTASVEALRGDLGAKPIDIAVDHRRLSLRTQAASVADALSAANVSVGRNDIVLPSRESAIPADGRIVVKRVVAWNQNICSRIKPRTLIHSDRGLRIGTDKTVSRGSDGLRQTLIRFVSIDGEPQKPRVISSRVIRTPAPRIVARGVTAAPIARVAQDAFERTGAMAKSALSMIATAYTAYCDGCSGTGRGATGVVVTHGIVAVDPSVIPLGTHLFIPGYGHAVAGDTGGAIIGHRIDLAFNSNDDAIKFGRRSVQVYVLHGKH